MKSIVSTNEFRLEYIESNISHPIVWERHCHTQFEMIAVADGDITVMLEGQNHRLKSDQIIILPPLSYHTVTANEKGSYHRITALFDLSDIPKVLQLEFEKKEKDAIIISSHYAQKLKEICQKNQAAFYAPLLQSLMVQIFYDALQANEKVDDIETDEFLKKSIQYIDLHLHEKICLDDLAKHTARSKSSFCHLFEKKMNISPKQYILQKKLAVAKKMIDEGTPYTVAAAQVGYENYSNFYRLYQKMKPLE